MSVLESHVDSSSAEFRENLAHMSSLEDDLRARLVEARRGGGEEAVKRQREQGKLLARERVERLLDPGTPFLEIGGPGRPRACTTARRRPRAWSPASGACADARS